MRECWNWQTGTFEGRVSMTYEFKSRLAHQIKNPGNRMDCGFRDFFVFGYRRLGRCLVVMPRFLCAMIFYPPPPGLLWPVPLQRYARKY